MLRRFLMLLAVCLLARPAGAHTVPTITVEAEFSVAREITLRVNLDPRLFISTQPASLPPVPASWWLEQNQEARDRSVADALSWLGRTLRFQIGETPLAENWKVTAIDSASAFPLGPNSAETHLLAEHRDRLPDVPGDFKITLDGRAPVGLILLNSLEGKAERHPQAIFPGETSRGFKLPERPSAVAAPAVAPDEQSAPVSSGGGLAEFCQPATRHFAGDHLVAAFVLAMVLGGRMISGAVMIASFQASHIIGALAVMGGWLPDAPLWMQAAGWVALGSGIFLAHRRELSRAVICFSIAGLCHGLNLPHLHLATEGSAAILRDAGLTGAAQMAIFALVRLALAVASRRRRDGKAGMQPC